MNFLKELTNSEVTLTPVDVKKINDRSEVNLADQTSDELDDEGKHWDAFFQSSCTSWFEHIKDFTFSSTFCTLLPSEALVIVEHWDALRKLRIRLAQDEASPGQIEEAETNLYITATAKLEDLQTRLETAIAVETALSPVGKAFVKLTTRSPKDSRKALKKAEEACQSRFTKDLATQSSNNDDSMAANTRWRILSEEMANACAVSTASDALELLLDSERVYEDLEFALRGKPTSSNKAPPRSTIVPTMDSVTAPEKQTPLMDDNATLATSVSSSILTSSPPSLPFDERLHLVARSWDPRLKPENEFRGICQDGQLTCLCQYFHPILFPDLPGQGDEIQADIFALFENPQVKAAVLSVGNNCIIDFAWLGSGDVMIIELNPFDGVCLGVFPASTGLFIWDNPVDKAIMSGEAPFEFRYRKELLPKHMLLRQFAKDWVNIIYPPSKSVKKEPLC